MCSENVFCSERRDRQRRRRSDDEGNLEADYEQHLSKHRRVDDDDDVEVRSLLPIKSKETGIVRRTIEITKRKSTELPTICKVKESGSLATLYQFSTAFI